jgi:hypothetical protein
MNKEGKVVSEKQNFVLILIVRVNHDYLASSSTTEEKIKEHLKRIIRRRKEKV